MNEQPAWIQMLFKRGHGLDAFDTRFLMRLHRELVEERLGEGPGRRDQLRSSALEQLQGDDPRTIVQSLAFLMVVGTPSDLPKVEPFLNHPHELVRKAASTCRFELRRIARRGEAPRPHWAGEPAN